jgi:predicted PurR-regulated permease PerM
MYLAREVLIPLAFALVLILIWSPPMNWLQKLHFRRAPAVLVVVVLSLGVAGDVGWIIPEPFCIGVRPVALCRGHQISALKFAV